MDPDQTLHTASDQDLHCLLKVDEAHAKMKQSNVPVQNHFPSLRSLRSETIDPPVLSVL